MEAVKTLIISLIKLYKYTVSPLLPPGCRFVPSCSEYSLKAVEKHGVLKGSWLSIKRVLKCHPFHLGGYDPVK